MQRYSDFSEKSEKKKIADIWHPTGENGADPLILRIQYYP